RSSRPSLPEQDRLLVALRATPFGREEPVDHQRGEQELRADGDEEEEEVVPHAMPAGENARSQYKEVRKGSRPAVGRRPRERAIRATPANPAGPPGYSSAPARPPVPGRRRRVAGRCQPVG